MDSKKLELEKILSITATEYCAMVGKPLREYQPGGVFGKANHWLVPVNTEVVVEFHVNKAHQDQSTLYHYLGNGTALIPKSKI